MKFNPLIPDSQYNQYHDWNIVHSPSLSLDWLRALLEIELPLKKSSNPAVLKLDESSLVLKLESDIGTLAVKHYHKYTLAKAISNTLGETLAKRSWRYAHHLLDQGFSTPEPLAYIEERRQGLYWRSWYINRFDESLNCDNYFLHSKVITPAMVNAVSEIVELFIRLRVCQLSHGDFKANNLLMSEPQPTIIDLDSMNFHASEKKAERMWHRDIQRFMESWRERYDIYKQFKQVFSKQGIDISTVL